MPTDTVPQKTEIDTILLVDDSPTNLQMLHHTLGGRGYRLLVAQNGAQALQIAQSAHPGLILLDIMMPGIDGFEVCRRLKADRATNDCAVIFLSALDHTEDKVRGFTAGAVDYISKPFEADEVIARVETHLKIRRLERSLQERNQALESANRHMREDLEAAARVQQALLPEQAPEMPGIRSGWLYTPCLELAGDSLDLIALDDNHLALYVLDVCGHGVPSALLAFTVTNSLRIARRSPRSPGDRRRSGLDQPVEVAQRLNRQFPMDFKSRLYFTLLYGVLDTRSGELRFVSAGNQGPSVLRRDGHCQIFDAPSLPIGLFADSEYRESRLRLEPGDRLFLHTDGLSEERNASGEELGRERLATAIGELRGNELNPCLEKLVAYALDWSGHTRLMDDVALVAIEYLGT